MSKVISLNLGDIFFKKPHLSVHALHENTDLVHLRYDQFVVRVHLLVHIDHLHLHLAHFPFPSLIRDTGVVNLANGKEPIGSVFPSPEEQDLTLKYHLGQRGAVGNLDRVGAGRIFAPSMQRMRPAR